MPTLTLTWRIKDAGACPICKAIDGWDWFFEGGEGIPEEFVHPEFGVVWNKLSGSEAHGRHKETCRCHLEPKFDLSDILAKTQALHDEVAAKAGTEEPPEI